MLVTTSKTIGCAPSFFSIGYSHTKALLVLLHSGLEGLSEVGTDPERRLVSFKVTSSFRAWQQGTAG